MTQRRHIPRLRVSDPMRGGAVTMFLGGGNAVRMAVADQSGDWPEEFFYAHEELDVAWCALDPCADARLLGEFRDGVVDRAGQSTRPMYASSPLSMVSMTAAGI
jgi:hypothetical protein